MTLFDQAVQSTASTLRIDGQPLNAQQISQLTAFLRAEGLEEDASSLINQYRPRLSDGSVYVVYSGSGARPPALAYIDEMQRSGLNAGTIGHTPYGEQISRLDTNNSYVDLASRLQDSFGGKLQYLDTATGGLNSINKYTITDVLWNYGSPEYISNGKDNGAGYFRGFFGDDIHPGRGFGSLELPELIGEKLNSETVRSNYTVNDALTRYQAFARAEETYKAIYRDQLWVDRQQIEPQLESDKFREHLDRSIELERRINIDFQVETSRYTQSELERAYLDGYRSSAERMAEYSSYSEQRAKLIVEAYRDVGDSAPEFIRNGMRKAAEYFEHPDGALNKPRVAMTMAASALAMADIWVEWDRRKNVPGAFELYLRHAANEAMQSLPLYAAIAAASMSPIGPAVIFSLTAVATYAAIRKVVGYLVNEYGLDQNGVVYQVLKTIDDSLTQFEKKSDLIWSGLRRNLEV